MWGGKYNCCFRRWLGEQGKQEHSEATELNHSVCGRKTFFRGSHCWTVLFGYWSREWWPAGKALVVLGGHISGEMWKKDRGQNSLRFIMGALACSDCLGIPGLPPEAGIFAYMGIPFHSFLFLPSVNHLQCQVQQTSMRALRAII